MTENELLELSAKALRIKLDYREGSDAYYYDDPNLGREQWIPTERDDQAFHLGCRLGLFASFMIDRHEMFQRFYREELDDNDRNPTDATRRAICRVAAEIGKVSMKGDAA